MQRSQGVEFGKDPLRVPGGPRGGMPPPEPPGILLRSPVVETVTINADGSIVCAADTQGQLHVFDLARTGVHAIPLRERAPVCITALCFVPTPQSEIVCACESPFGRRLRVVDPLSLRLITTLVGHQSQILSVSASPSLILTHSNDAMILWRASDWTRVRTMAKPVIGVLACQAEATGGSVVVLYGDARVGLWASETGALEAQLPPPPAVDGECQKWSAVAIAGDCVAACEPGKRFVAVWHLVRSKMHAAIGHQEKAPSILEAREPILQIFLRHCAHRSSGSTGNINGGPVQRDVQNPTSLIIGTSNSVCIVNVDSLCILLEVAVRGLLHIGLDQRSSRIVLAHKEGLEWRNLGHKLALGIRASTLASRNARRGSNSVAQPAQGPHRIPRVRTERLSPIPDDEGELGGESILEDTAQPTDLNIDTADVEQRRMIAFLRRHCVYPAKYRAFVWQRLAQLPRNEIAHRKLGKQGTSERALELVELAGLTNEHESSRNGALLVDTLSKLTAWAPALANVPQLPATIARFLEVFATDAVLSFEMCAFFLLNWGSHVLDTFPSPPLESLEKARILLVGIDPELTERLDMLSEVSAAAETSAQDVPAQECDLRSGALWPLIQDGLARCLPHDTWLTMWDHLITRWREGPALLDVAACAVLRCLREPLLELPLSGGSDLLKCALRQTRVIPAARLVEEFYELRARSFASASSLPSAPKELPLQVGKPYPPLLRGPHFVLDYLTMNRSITRKEAKDAKLAIKEAARLNAAIESLVAEEIAASIDQRKTLRAERARRELMRQDDAQLEAERRKCAQEVAAARVSRINSACEAVEAALTHEKEAHEAEVARLADEMSRRRRLASLDVETRDRELEITEVEGVVSQQLTELMRQRRASAEAQKLRQDVREAIMERDQKEEATRRQRYLENERETSQARIDAERHIKEHQLEMALIQRQEVQEMLAVDEQERQAQQGAVAHAREARAAAREARADADEKLQRRQQWLQATLGNLMEHYETKQRDARMSCGRRLQAQRLALADAQRELLRSVELQSKKLQSAALAEEQERFDIQLRRLVASDEATSEDFQAQVRRFINEMEHMRAAGEEDQAFLERKRELVTLQDAQSLRAQGLASELLREARQEFSERMGLDEALGSSSL